MSARSVVLDALLIYVGTVFVSDNIYPEAESNDIITLDTILPAAGV
jgi:hypothetical protein